MEKKQKIVVLGIIEDNKGNVLISQRFDPKIKDAHLKWDLVGGTNEFGESLKDTLKREILEETGLNVEIFDMMPESVSSFWQHSDYTLHSLVFCYRCKLIYGELILNDPKINDLKWVKPQQLINFNFLPTTKSFIDIYIKSIEN